MRMFIIGLDSCLGFVLYPIIDYKTTDLALM